MYLYFLFAVFLGAVLSSQVGINSTLSKHIDSNLWAAIISFSVGTLCLLAYAIVSQSYLSIHSLAKTPWHYYVGGALGAIYVFSAIILFPKIGATNLVLFVVLGQTLGSSIIDHYGLFTSQIKPINKEKILSILVIIAGLYFYQRSK